MICADFLAGANLDGGNPDVLLDSILRLVKFLPGEQKNVFRRSVEENAVL
jgi:hypothetical protein